jgi:hypothetical protein
MKVLVTGGKQSGEYGEVWGYALPPGKGSLKLEAANPTLLSVRMRGTGALGHSVAERLASKPRKIVVEVDPDRFSQVETVPAEAGLLAKYRRDLIDAQDKPALFVGHLDLVAKAPAYFAL